MDSDRNGEIPSRYDLYGRTSVRPVTISVPRVVQPRSVGRATHRQNWAAYNAAQTHEKGLFLNLLHALLSGVVDPVQTKGRPRIPLREILFASAYKVYSGVSARRFMADLRLAAGAGFISRPPHYNSILGALAQERTTPILVRLVADSAKPLLAIERDFAVDSTAIRLPRFYRDADGRRCRDWLKVHAMAGVLTNVIVNVEITDRSFGDCPELPALVEAVHEYAEVESVSADRAYASHENATALEGVGAKNLVRFRVGAKETGVCEAWDRAYHLFAADRGEFWRLHQRRSNVEATFAALKRRFGGRVRSRRLVAAVNETLCKVLAHNIACVTHAMYELGIAPEFSATDGEANG